jgi:hypothetical protein
MYAQAGSIISTWAAIRGVWACIICMPAAPGEVIAPAPLEHTVTQEAIARDVLRGGIAALVAAWGSGAALSVLPAHTTPTLAGPCVTTARQDAMDQGQG